MQGVYLMYYSNARNGNPWYVGMTTNNENRYPLYIRCKYQVMFIPVKNASDLRWMEKKLIRICQKLGLPLSNVQHNRRR